MRAVHWISMIIVVAAVSFLALSNPDVVSLSLWPLPLVAKAPLYLIVVASLICGVLIGAATVWIEGHRRRHELRECRRQKDALSHELAAAQERLGRDPRISQRPAASAG
jgi:uncharacterized integral membrane protein